MYMCNDIYRYITQWNQQFIDNDQEVEDDNTMVMIINTLRAKFFRRNINMYLHFVSFVNIDRTQVVEILPQTRQEPTYST